MLRPRALRGLARLVGTGWGAQLEEGEVDDRLPYFRQCVLRELNRNDAGEGAGTASYDGDDGAADDAADADRA